MKLKLIVVIFIIVFITALSSLLFRFGATRNRLLHTSIPITKLDADAIKVAFSEYFRLFGAYPSGNNYEISKALAGDNPQNISIIAFKHTDKNGEMLDPWGKPYDIQLNENINLQIRSAGANRTMGDADDVIFDYILKRSDVR